jgi:hypothetical protein
MELRTLQAPSALETLLGSLLASQNWVMAEAPRILKRSDLPEALQNLTIKARAKSEIDLAQFLIDARMHHGSVRIFRCN